MRQGLFSTPITSKIATWARYVQELHACGIDALTKIGVNTICNEACDLVYPVDGDSRFIPDCCILT